MDGQMSNSILEPLTIQSQVGSYQVTFSNIEENDFDEDAIGLVDNISSVLSKVEALGIKHIIEILAVEEKKNVYEATQILEKLAELKTTKNMSITAIGGGIVQDLATFACSLYMRGLKWTYVPTTLMSAMDSCIGGKSSINLGKFKNLIGNFYPPSQIIIDMQFAYTLSTVDISSGVAEGMKICFAKGQSEFENFRSQVLEWRKSANINALQKASWISLKAKKWFIEIDEFDQKERKLLNFGHSFGHALEAASNFEVPHGIGVLLGMKAAIYESGNQDKCGELLSFIDYEIEQSAFSQNTFQVSKLLFMDALARDKKNTKSEQVLILPNKKGHLEMTNRPLDTNSLESCLSSLRRALEESKVSCEIF